METSRADEWIRELDKAGELAKWLIESKKKKRIVAYSIAAHKYGIPHIDIVRQKYLKIRSYQPYLFPTL